MRRKSAPQLVMGIALTTRGLGYVILEGPETPFDWGVMRRENKDFAERTVERIQKLVRAYHPDIVVLERLSGGQTRHSTTVKRMSQQLLHCVAGEGVVIIFYDRHDVRRAFAPLGALSKPEIAQAVAIALPALKHRLPPIRKLWMSEDARQLIFDAAALALTYYVELEGNAR
jgi:Holliday junction resolvasome RuvABC endonuclease subunit